MLNRLYRLENSSSILLPIVEGAVLVIVMYVVLPLPTEVLVDRASNKPSFSSAFRCFQNAAIFSLTVLIQSIIFKNLNSADFGALLVDTG